MIGMTFLSPASFTNASSTRRDQKDFPFPFHLRAVRGDPIQYYLVGPRDLARIKQNSVALGDKGNLAIFKLFKEAGHTI
jgi:hypothetical protein